MDYYIQGLSMRLLFVRYTNRMFETQYIIIFNTTYNIFNTKIINFSTCPTRNVEELIILLL